MQDSEKDIDADGYRCVSYSFFMRQRVLSSDMLICAEKVNFFQQQSKKEICMLDLHQQHRYLLFLLFKYRKNVSLILSCSDIGMNFSNIRLFSFRKQTKLLFPTPRRLPCHPSNMYTACIYPIQWMQSYRPDGDSEGM